ncbi:ATP-dependent RNA helicase [methanogenic archaeon ISO4-H5]|nr:ATP-dependent RNA helicase [methanogenic archaeon ISO4-H5]
MTQSRFEDLGISKDVLKAVRSIGWSAPTPVQAAAIPVGLEGADLLAQAQTGTGKTGTFGSIILSRTKSGSSDPTSLVLVPTRELASQVSEEMERLSEYSGHVCIPIYGGVNIETQAKQLKKGADAVIATPGRLKDLIERKMIKLDSVEIVVLDEADRMLDMGFAPSVNMILSRITKDRQTMMFSATMPEEVMKMAVKHMYDHKEILVSKDEPTLDLTEQFYIMTNRDSKRDELVHLIEDGYPKMMVFCRTKRKVDYLTRKLKRDEYNVEGIHGDIGQNKRERVIKDFAGDKLQVLIASDVASRGLDIDGVDVVVNYDIPVDPETYIHRIGRTGRAGKTGKAITFVTSDDIKGLNSIEKTVAKKITELPWTSSLYTEDPSAEPVPKAAKAPKKQQQKKEAPKKAEPKKQVPKKEKEPDTPVKGERTLRGKLDKGVRRDAQPKAEKPAAKPKTEPAPKTKVPERHKTEKKEILPEAPPAPQNNGRYVPLGVPKNPHPLHAYVGIVRAAHPKKDMSFDRLELNVGSDDGLDVDKLRHFVIKTAGVDSKDVGNIHIMDNKARVQVVRYRSQEVVDELFGQVINGKRVLVTNLSDKH